MTPSNGAGERLQLLGRLDAEIEKLSREFCELNASHLGERMRETGYPEFRYVPQDHDTEHRVVGLALEIERLRFTRACVVAGILPVNNGER